ncbi:MULTISPECIES: ferrochelatase [Planococcus]|uniref:Coproporphyrin III ferrochelatase n=1 Tax=Planococcus rifietoensis TaxID=200991 RepID=A0A0U2Z5W6_9BACL|nr:MULTISPECIES: ferrochelatase [Planococcus]ALS74580.1 ferrochelatase [Planococcus rifietoensis]AUD13438.1 ferrochelatase [Planococcus sp. MB-3u-03]PKG46153.1 ferrochelatase [Planococcus sp. Urea-trap-24]PKG89858.1 ferrochelatase [Planococcus sp. Urea-3u-39]PKH43944.1 ferrochelatase [Planococcus sp. MB-3u-09]
MMKKTMGLLVMAYGTPYSEDDIERYYTHIRRGRKPSEEALQDLKDRYKAIGGISPLARITEDQANGLCDRLNELQDDIEFKMYLGLKHIEPFVEDGVEEMKKDGIEEAISIVLAPHFSTFSVKSYNGRAKETADKLGIKLTSVESWYTEPKFIQFWSEKVSAAFAEMSEQERAKSCLIVSAHSLPEKIIANGDPYPDQLKETADLIAEAAGVENYEIGWQSAGQTPEPWIGPDVQDLTRELHEEKGYNSFVYTPVGFITDHLEVLYDNDYECKVVCDEIGATYRRPEMPNVDPLFIDGMANVVLNKLNEN